MRLGKLARNHNLPVPEIIDFVNASEFSTKDVNVNTKLSDELVESIANEFGFEQVETESIANKSIEEINEDFTTSPATTEFNQEIVAEEIEVFDQVIETHSEDATYSTNIPEAVDEDVPDSAEDLVNEIDTVVEQEKIEISSEQLLEMIENEDESIDLEQITTIRAPKKELDGLKVLGKIELPEEKPKPEKKSKERSQKPQLSEEEKEKQRLRAKKKKEAYEAKKERKKKNKEQARLKAQKEAHYRQRIENVAIKQTKKKALQTKNSPEPKPVESSPKTVLGRFWKWLNT